VRLHHLPPGLESEVYAAIAALASCTGLAPIHLQTIRYCIAECPEAFERSYLAYFEELTSVDPNCSERSSQQAEPCISS
jgi:hypothetical protein